jgi:hypothetical protein
MLDTREPDMELVGGRAAIGVAGLPASLLVSGLSGQISRASQDYPQTNYLVPILDAVRFVRRRSDGGQVLGELDSAVRRILFSVVERVERDWDFRVEDFGFDLSGEGGELDALELYEFFIAERVRNATELVYQTVVLERRRLANAYRKAVSKTDQTVSEARKTLLNFDDVIVWMSVPAIVSEMASGDSWSVGLGESLDRIGCSPSGEGILSWMAGAWDDPTFSRRYAEPVLSGGGGAALVTAVRSRWLNEAEKKARSDAE